MSDNDSVPPLAQTLWAMSDQVAKLQASLSLALSEDGLSVEQFRAMEAITRLESPVMGELVKDTGFANASLSRIIDGLEDQALAYRVPDPTDKRRITVQLSALGESLFRRACGRAAQWAKASEASFTN
jgi:DNA-binding MarR family transcriptional regulator